jgi:hypothetical protein
MSTILKLALKERANQGAKHQQQNHVLTTPSRSQNCAELFLKRGIAPTIRSASLHMVVTNSAKTKNSTPDIRQRSVAPSLSAVSAAMEIGVTLSTLKLKHQQPN